LTSERPPASATGFRGRRVQLLARLGPLPRPVRRALGHPVLESLATPHGVSRYLEAVHPLWALEGGRALVTGTQAETSDMVTLTLRPGHQWAGFAAGQHVRVGVEIDGTVRTRTYSISSSQHRGDGQLTITVKRKAGGLVSGHLVTQVRPGDVLACSAATGEVVLPAPRPERLLLISGGSGITPMASMLRTLADEQHPGRVIFLHYARTRDDVAFADDLTRIGQELADTEVVVVPTGPGGAGPVAGRFVPAHLEQLVPDHLEVPTFACGPSGLVDAVDQHYGSHGAAQQLRVERFSPPTLQPPTGPGGGTVRFAASGVERADDGRSLLEQAESAGLTPEFGCRLGICHTCTQHKVAGGTVDLRSGRRCDAPGTSVQICVSVPAGDVVLDL
jgi:stearoyl-CoA 9-desaturase NADPH oxidoreductase